MVSDNDIIEFYSGILPYGSLDIDFFIKRLKFADKFFSYTIEQLVDDIENNYGTKDYLSDINTLIYNLFYEIYEFMKTDIKEDLVEIKDSNINDIGYIIPSNKTIDELFEIIENSECDFYINALDSHFRLETLDHLNYDDLDNIDYNKLKIDLFNEIIENE